MAHRPGAERRGSPDGLRLLRRRPGHLAHGRKAAHIGVCGHPEPPAEALPQGRRRCDDRHHITRTRRPSSSLHGTGPSAGRTWISTARPARFVFRMGIRSICAGGMRRGSASAPALQSPNSDSLSYLAAVVRGEIRSSGLSSVEVNMVVTEILDAAPGIRANGPPGRLAGEPALVGQVSVLGKPRRPPAAHPGTEPSILRCIWPSGTHLPKPGD